MTMSGEGRRDAPPGTRPRRLLVIADEACAGSVLFDEVRYRAGRAGTVRIVAPALTGRGRYWASDEDAGRREAERRLGESFAACASTGVRVDGAVGDADPLQALDDEMRTFAPDEVIIATRPADEENWLEHGVVGMARERYDVPITHVVVGSGGAASRAVPPEDEPSVREGHSGRDLILLVVTGVLAIAGSLGTFLLAGADASDLALGLWIVFLDLGLKALFVVVLWSLFLRRGRADRLDY